MNAHNSWIAGEQSRCYKLNTLTIGPDDTREKDSVIDALKERDRARDQHLHETESEHQKLHGKFRHEESAVGHLRGSVVDFEAVRLELVKRLNTNARLDALPEQSMHQVRDELHLAVSGFRASEEESESEQYRVFLVRAQEIAGMEQQVADQVARVSHAEHRVNEEHAAICRHKQMHDYEAQQELDRLRIECSQSRIDFLRAIKDTGALQRE